MQNSSTATPSPRSAAVLLALGCAGLWAWTGGLWDLWGADEGRYVQVAHELLGRPDWLHLTLLGEPYDQKPPLPFWIYAAMLALNGGEISTWLVRLPPVLFAAGTVFLTWSIGRHRLGERAGLMAGLVLLTTAQFALDAVSVELNTMFTGWIVLGLWAWLTRPETDRLSWGRAALYAGAMAGAFFTKGPLAFLVMVVPPMVEARQQRSWALLVRGKVWLALGTAVALAAGWLVVQKLNSGAGFVAGQAREQTVGRLFGTDHAEPFWWYFPQVFVGVMPLWSLAVAGAAWALWRGRRSAELRPLMPLAGWAGIPFLVLCIASGKRQSYLLPLLPAAALLAGWWLDRIASERPRAPRLGSIVTGACAVLALGFVAAAVLAVLSPEAFGARGIHLRPWQAAPLGLVALGAAATAVCLGRAGRTTPATFGALVAIAWMVLLADLSVLRPAVNPHHTTRPFALGMDRFVAAMEEKRLAGVGKAGRAHYHVYGHYGVTELFRENAVLRLPSPLPPLVVARDSDLDEVGDDLAKAGYTEVHRATAEDDLMVVFATPVARERLEEAAIIQR